MESNDIKRIAEALGYEIEDDSVIIDETYFPITSINLSDPSIVIQMIDYLLKNDWDFTYDKLRRHYEASKEFKRKMRVEYSVKETLTDCVIEAMLKLT